MRRLNDFITEDTNQFGPGTDLVISLVAVMMVMTVIIASILKIEQARLDSLLNEQRDDYAALKKENQMLLALASGGHFKLSAKSFPAGDFKVKPVIQLTNPEESRIKVEQIIGEYRAYQSEFPFIFVVGHANRIDDPNAAVKSYEARLQRNWEYAGRRAAMIASLIQNHLTDLEKGRMVVMTTGEFDLKFSDEPFAQDNAWVEVVFGKEWKPPSDSRFIRP